MEIKHYDQASQLWLQFKDGLKGYIFKKTNNAQLADEINQEVLLKVINSCCSNIEIKNVRSWLFQIAHNTTIAFLKEHKKYVSEAVELSESNDKSDSVYEDIIPFLEPLIEFLPDKYALPLKMADIDGIKHREIADQLGLTLSAVKSRVLRARKLLQNEVLTCFDLSEKDPKYFELKSSCTPLKSFRMKKDI